VKILRKYVRPIKSFFDLGECGFIPPANKYILWLFSSRPPSYNCPFRGRVDAPLIPEEDKG
jgi:hypothetical protein